MTKETEIKNLEAEYKDMTDIIGQALWLVGDQLIGYRKRNHHTVMQEDKDFVHRWCGNDDIINADTDDIDLDVCTNAEYVGTHGLSLTDKYHDKASHVFYSHTLDLMRDSSEDSEDENGQLRYHYQEFKDTLHDLRLLEADRDTLDDKYEPLTKQDIGDVVTP